MVTLNEKIELQKIVNKLRAEELTKNIREYKEVYRPYTRIIK